MADALYLDNEMIENKSYTRKESKSQTRKKSMKEIRGIVDCHMVTEVASYRQIWPNAGPGHKKETERFAIYL